MITPRHLVLAAVAVATFGLATPSTNAGTFTWDGGGADDDWSTGANWAGNVAPNPAGTDNLIFAGSTRLTPVAELAKTAEVGRLILVHVNPLASSAEVQKLESARAIFSALEIGCDKMIVDL